MGCLGMSWGCLGDVLGLINRESAQFTWCSSTNESNDTLALVHTPWSSDPPLFT